MDGFTKQQLVDYDKLLNGPDNDWDIYYWITGKLTTPDCYDNHIMELLKKHALNCNKEQRYSQPELKTPTSDTWLVYYCVERHMISVLLCRHLISVLLCSDTWLMYYIEYYIIHS